jgi:hypothetical protein
MSPELDQKLCEKFPKIFRNRYAPINQTCMGWGLDVGDGWYDIIDMACTTIQSHIDNSRRNRISNYCFNRALREALKGNMKPIEYYFCKDRPVSSHSEKVINDVITKRSFRDIPTRCEQLVATQVKEKFGTLRFYYVGGDDYCDGVMSLADNMSAVTCERCGKPGKTRNKGWVATLCDEHAIAEGKMDNNDED